MNTLHAHRIAFAAGTLLATAVALSQPIPPSPVPTPVPTPMPAVPVPGPVLVPVPGSRPVPIRPVPPIVVGPQDSTGRGSLADSVPGDVPRHIKLTLTYDGSRIKLLRSARGVGPPRSYLYQQAELRVDMRDAAGAKLRSFTLPDPRQVRSRDTFVREVPVRIPRGRAIPTPAQPLPSDLRIPIGNRSKESVGQRAEAQFELFLPDLPEATTVVITRGTSSRTTLGRIDLAEVR